MEKYVHGIKKVMDDGREIHLMCSATGEAWGIRAVTPMPQDDPDRVGCVGFDIEAHRKLMIKEVDGCVVSQMGLSAEALRHLIMMAVNLLNQAGESQREYMSKGISVQDSPEGTGEGIQTP